MVLRMYSAVNRIINDLRKDFAPDAEQRMELFEAPASFAGDSQRLERSTPRASW